MVSWFIAIGFIATVSVLWSWFFFQVPHQVGRFFGEVEVKSPIATLEDPDEKFVVEQCHGGSDSKLDEVFGKADDDVEMPRQWMRNMDDGALQNLKVDEMPAALTWLLTPAFRAPFRGFDARVSSGTTHKVVISAFLIRKDGSVALFPLVRTAASGNGIYVFRVPESKKGDRLLVFIGMRKVDFDAIVSQPKFSITSRS